MSKILQGKIISNKMLNTAIVEVVRLSPHPLYKKLLKRSKKYKVETGGQKVEIGATVKIIETSPMAKDKHFRLLQDEKPIKKTAKTKKSPGKKEEAKI